MGTFLVVLEVNGGHYSSSWGLFWALGVVLGESWVVLGRLGSGVFRRYKETEKKQKTIKNQMPGFIENPPTRIKFSYFERQKKQRNQKSIKHK